MEVPEEEGGCLETIFRLSFGITAVVTLVGTLLLFVL